MKMLRRFERSVAITILALSPLVAPGVAAAVGSGPQHAAAAFSGGIPNAGSRPANGRQRPSGNAGRGTGGSGQRGQRAESAAAPGAGDGAAQDDGSAEGEGGEGHAEA